MSSLKKRYYTSAKDQFHQAQQLTENVLVCPSSQCMDGMPHTSMLIVARTGLRYFLVNPTPTGMQHKVRSYGI